MLSTMEDGFYFPGRQSLDCARRSRRGEANGLGRPLTQPLFAYGGLFRGEVTTCLMRKQANCGMAQ